MRLGAVVEGLTDMPVFEELLPRIHAALTRVVVLGARGKPSFLSLFPKLLWAFQYVEPGGPADKALVIRDANNGDVAAVERAMERAMEGRSRPPLREGIRYHATRRETETWLLADFEAINRVAAQHGGSRVGPVPGPLERIDDAKERFKALLWQAGLPHVEGIVREIAREIELEVLRSLCPSFRTFEEKVRG